MALQDEVNDQVAAIHAGIDQATQSALALDGQIAAIADAQEIDHSPIAAVFSAISQTASEVSGAFVAVADAVDTLEAAIDSIEITPGEDGAAATIEIGTVTTLSPGAPATVVNVGTASAAVLNFGIPQGADGAVGGSAIDFGDDDPNDLTYVEFPGLYIQTTSPHKVWKRVGGAYEDIT